MNRYLSISETAALLGCSTATVSRCIRAGRLRAVRLSSQLVRVDVSSIQDLDQKFWPERDQNRGGPT